MIPDLGNELTKKLYSTFLSYLQPNDFSLSVPINSDERGRLFEVIKSKNNTETDDEKGCATLSHPSPPSHTSLEYEVLPVELRTDTSPRET